MLKKIIFLWVVALILVPFNIGLAAESTIAENVTPGTYALASAKLGQTFSVDRSKYNSITKISIKINNKQPGNFNIRVFSDDFATPFADLTNRETGTNADTEWYDFIPNSSFNLPQNQSTSFSFIVDIPNGATTWEESSTNQYSGGTKIQEVESQGAESPTVFADKDMLFKVYGSSATDVNATQNINTNTSPTPTVSTSNSNSVNTNSNTNSVIDNTSIIGNKALKSVDASIVAPTFGYIIKNDEKINAPISGDVEILQGDTLKIGGTASPNANIVILIGQDSSFSFTAGADGKFESTISTTDLALGTYAVAAQTQDAAKNKGSQTVSLFNLKVSAATAEVVNSTSQTFWQKITGKYFWYTICIMIIIILGLSLLLLYFVKKRRKSLLGGMPMKVHLKKTHMRLLIMLGLVLAMGTFLYLNPSILKRQASGWRPQQPGGGLPPTLFGGSQTTCSADQVCIDSADSNTITDPIDLGGDQYACQNGTTCQDMPDLSRTVYDDGSLACRLELTSIKPLLDQMAQGLAIPVGDVAPLIDDSSLNDVFPVPDYCADGTAYLTDAQKQECAGEFAKLIYNPILARNWDITYRKIFAWAYRQSRYGIFKLPEKIPVTHLGELSSPVGRSSTIRTNGSVAIKGLSGTVGGSGDISYLNYEVVSDYTSILSVGAAYNVCPNQIAWKSLGSNIILDWKIAINITNGVNSYKLEYVIPDEKKNVGSGVFFNYLWRR